MVTLARKVLHHRVVVRLSMRPLRALQVLRRENELPFRVASCTHVCLPCSFIPCNLSNPHERGRGAHRGTSGPVTRMTLDHEAVRKLKCFLLFF